MRMETARNKMGLIAFECVCIDLVRSMLMPTFASRARVRVYMAQTRAYRMSQESAGHRNPQGHVQTYWGNLLGRCVHPSRQVCTRWLP